MFHGRFADLSMAHALSQAVLSGEMTKVVSVLEKTLADNDDYLRVQLQVDGPDGDVYDPPWEYLTLPWQSDQPLATDERTPFARRIDRWPRGFQPSNERELRILVVFCS